MFFDTPRSCDGVHNLPSTVSDTRYKVCPLNCQGRDSYLVAVFRGHIIVEAAEMRRTQTP